MKLNRKN